MRRHKNTVGIFRHYFFILTTLVLFCLSVASLSLLLLMSSYWYADLQAELLNNNSSLSDILQNVQTIDDKSSLWIKRTVEKIASSASSVIFITDANGNIIICSDDEAENAVICSDHAETVFQMETLAAIADSDDGYCYRGNIDVDQNGEKYFFAGTLCHNNNEQYFIISVQNFRAGFQPYIKPYIKMMLIAVCIAVILAFFSSWAATYRIVRPLKKMAEATKHYANGDFKYRIREYSHFTEFYDLTDAFNRMAKKLEVNETSRRNFVANVSHELKTPMTTISGFVDGILDGTIQPEEEEHYLRIVSDVVKHLSELVISMLNVSKIEAGKVELEFSEVSFDQTIIHTIIGFEKTITEKDIDVLGLDKLENITIRADEALLRQIIYNLIDNAVKFTHIGGILKFELYEEKNNAVFVISNSGSVIAPEELENIFERFYKIDKSRGLDSSSFGLGLHIVKSIVEMHGGDIKAVSKDNQTKFIVKLPL